MAEWDRTSLQQFAHRAVMEVLQLNEQFVSLAAKRKEPEQVVFHFVSREAKSQSLWPLAF